MKKRRYKLHEIFTPSQPAKYTYIERKDVDKRLNRALQTPGKQIILYGHSGAGKTTILTNKFKTEKIKSITTRCVKGMSLSDIIIDAFNQLEVYYLSESTGLQEDKLGAGLSASYFGIKATLSGETKDQQKTTTKRAVELPITPQTLAKFIGLSNNLWVIEDFHKIPVSEKTQMAQIMKVFMDSSIDYPKLKIIAIGAVNSAREVVQYDPEMKSRITEIEVPLMSNNDLSDILSKGENLLNISFPSSVSDKIVAYSSGLAAVTHQLALLVCEESNVKETYDSRNWLEISEKSFEGALDEYLAENSDTLKSVYEHATHVANNRKYENPTDLLKAILTVNKESVSLAEIKETIQLENRNYKGNNLKKYIEELTTPERSEILRYNKDSRTFYFSNPFIKAYCQCILRNDVKKESIDDAVVLKEFRSTLDRELEIARRAFLKDFMLGE